jgi:hypothetical protein
MSLDRNRFSDPHAFYRVIVYTNGTIVDPPISDTAGELKMMQLLAERYSTSFSGADAYVYAVSGGEAGTSLELERRLFSSFFLIIPSPGLFRVWPRKGPVLQAFPGNWIGIIKGCARRP